MVARWQWARGTTWPRLALALLLLPSVCCHMGSEASADCRCSRPKEPVTNENLFAYAMALKSVSECKNSQVMFHLDGKKLKEYVCGLKGTDWVEKLKKCVGTKTPIKCIEKQKPPVMKTAQSSTRATTILASTEGKEDEELEATGEGWVSTTVSVKYSEGMVPGKSMPRNVSSSTDPPPSPAQSHEIEGNGTQLTNWTITTDSTRRNLSPGSTVFEKGTDSNSDSSRFGGFGQDNPGVDATKGKEAVISLVVIVFFLVILIIGIMWHKKKGGIRNQRYVMTPGEERLRAEQNHSSGCY